MNLFKLSLFKNTWAILVLIGIGMSLLLAIYLTTAKLFSTYVDIENDRAESFWSVIQLQKELDAMYSQTKLYQANASDHDTLKLRYELLWSRFPIVQNMLKKDEIFSQIDGLADDINMIFEHVQKMERTFTQKQALNMTQLNVWTETLAADRMLLNRYIVNSLSGFDDDYVTMVTSKLLKYLIFIAILNTVFILYLGFLLNMLILQQKNARFLLAHDSLTGLKSRVYILETISKRCQHKKAFTLINFDLNKFKQINDHYGHHTGDQVLLHLSGLFKKTIAQSGEVGRVGGDEFLWVTDIVDREDIDRLYEELLTQLKRSFVTENNHLIQLKISAGGSLASDNSFDANQLKDEADRAMYLAKTAQVSTIWWQHSASELKQDKPTSNTRSLTTALTLSEYTDYELTR